MSLSNDAVLNTLQSKFVCGFRNIKGEPWAGKSGSHDPDAPAVVTTNGAGPHNVQMFFMSSDGTVLHVLPGYWAPEDLLREERFAEQLNQLWHSPISLDEKKMQFAQLQLEHVRTHPMDMVLRSHLQSFDAKAEGAKKNSDFHFKPGDYHPAYSTSKHTKLKSTDQVLHERMSKQPFVAYEKFDVEKFSNYGKTRYDKKEEMRTADASGKMKKKK